jgi:hypothetical protein
MAAAPTAATPACVRNERLEIGFGILSSFVAGGFSSRLSKLTLPVGVASGSAA